MEGIMILLVSSQVFGNAFAPQRALHFQEGRPALFSSQKQAYRSEMRLQDAKYTILDGTLHEKTKVSTQATLYSGR